MTLPFLTEEEKPFLVQFEDITERAQPLPKGVMMRVRGLAHVAGKITANGNLYKPEYHVREADRLKPDMESGSVFMYPRHPRTRKEPDGSVKVEAMSPTDATGLLRAIDVLPNDDGTANVYIESDIGDTTKGKDIAALIRMGAKVPISSRARGTSRRVVMTDKHPLAAANPEWIGKQFNEINEDFTLRTYDFVDRAASSGSETTHWREEEEEEIGMEFDINKLTEDQWKQIAEHANVKKLIEEAVKAAKEEKDKEHAEGVQKQVDEAIAKYVQSDEFAAMFEKENLDEAKCPECEATIPKGAKYCPGCGAEMAKAAKPGKKEGEDDEDPKVEELRKQNDAMAKTIESLTKDIKDLRTKLSNEEEQEAVESIVEETLKGKPGIVQEKVRKRLAKLSLTEENAEEQVKDEVKEVEAIFEHLGVKPEDLPKGKGKVINEDVEAEKKEAQSALDEAQRGQLNRLRHF